MKDSSSNFYIEEKDIVQRRVEISIKRLKELNSNVEGEILNDGNFSEHINEYNILIITEIMEIEEIEKLNEMYHEKKKGFIYCSVFGLSFFCFVDYGDIVIRNSSNSDYKKYFIKEIKKGINAKITIDNQFDTLELNECDEFIFKDIKGMEQLLDSKKRKITKIEENVFEIGEDSTNYDDYIQGDIVEEVVEHIHFYNNKFEDMIYLLNEIFCFVGAKLSYKSILLNYFI